MAITEYNKKVLLRERKEAYCLPCSKCSLCCCLLMGEGGGTPSSPGQGVRHPDLSWVPLPHLDLGYCTPCQLDGVHPSHLDLGWGAPRVTPPTWTWDGVPPAGWGTLLPGPGVGYTPTSWMGYPYLDLGWGTPLDLGWGTPPTVSWMGYPLLRNINRHRTRAVTIYS